MFTANSNFGNNAAAMVGAIAMSAVCMFVAVSPARADTPASFRGQVETSIDKTLEFPAGVGVDTKGVTTLAVSIDADGAVGKVDVIKSSGNRSFDREALRTAKTVSYPAGEARTIAMVLGFNRRAVPADAQRAAQLIAAYRNDPRQLLAQTTTQPVG